MPMAVVAMVVDTVYQLVSPIIPLHDHDLGYVLAPRSSCPSSSDSSDCLCSMSHM